MKKRSTVLIILVAVMLGIGVLYFIMTKTAENDTPPSMTIETTPLMIAQDDPATIVKLEYSYNGENLSFDFSNVAYKWYYTADNKFPLEQTFLQTMASVISSMAVNRVVEETRDNFAQYGLDNPSITVSATFQPEKEDSYTRTYHVGDLNTFNNTYYFNVDGTDTVYAIASAFVPYFAYNLIDLAVVDVVPLFTTATIEMKSCDVDGNVITDADTLTDISKSFAGLTIGKPVAYEVVETSVNVVIDYTETVTVSNEDGSISSTIPAEKKFTCKFGNDTDDGETYFTVNDSGLVYLVDMESAKAIIANFSS
jgi:hypothetical protein